MQQSRKCEIELEKARQEVKSVQTECDRACEELGKEKVATELQRNENRNLVKEKKALADENTQFEKEIKTLEQTAGKVAETLDGLQNKIKQIRQKCDEQETHLTDLGRTNSSLLGELASFKRHEANLLQQIKDLEAELQYCSTQHAGGRREASTTPLPVRTIDEGFTSDIGPSPEGGNAESGGKVPTTLPIGSPGSAVCAEQRTTPTSSEPITDNVNRGSPDEQMTTPQSYCDDALMVTPSLASTFIRSSSNTPSEPARQEREMSLDESSIQHTTRPDSIMADVEPSQERDIVAKDDMVSATSPIHLLGSDIPAGDKGDELEGRTQMECSEEQQPTPAGLAPIAGNVDASSPDQQTITPSVDAYHVDLQISGNTEELEEDRASPRAEEPRVTNPRQTSPNTSPLPIDNELDNEESPDDRELTLEISLRTESSSSRRKASAKKFQSSHVEDRPLLRRSARRQVDVNPEAGTLISSVTVTRRKSAQQQYSTSSKERLTQQNANATSAESSIAEDELSQAEDVDMIPDDALTADSCGNLVDRTPAAYFPEQEPTETNRASVADSVATPQSRREGRMSPVDTSNMDRGENEPTPDLESPQEQRDAEEAEAVPATSPIGADISTADRADKLGDDTQEACPPEEQRIFITSTGTTSPVDQVTSTANIGRDTSTFATSPSDLPRMDLPDVVKHNDGNFQCQTLTSDVGPKGLSRNDKILQCYRELGIPAQFAHVAKEAFNPYHINIGSLSDKSEVTPADEEALPGLVEMITSCIPARDDPIWNRISSYCDTAVPESGYGGRRGNGLTGIINKLHRREVKRQWGSVLDGFVMHSIIAIQIALLADEEVCSIALNQRLRSNEE